MSAAREALAVTLTVEQLSELVREQLRVELERMPHGNVKEVFNLTEAAAFLDRHPKKVMELVRDKLLPAHFISEREPRFKRTELLAWLDTLPGLPALAAKEV
jgi:hypothetical protein